MPLPASQFLQCVVYIQGASLEKDLRNIYHLLARATPVDGSTQQSVADALRNGFDTLFTPLLSANCQTIGVSCRNLDVPTDEGQLDSNWGTPTVGGVAGDSLPAQSAIVGRLYTGMRGRTYRGSNHYALVPEASTTDDKITTGGDTTAWKTALSTFATGTFLGNIGTTNWDLAIWSPFLTGPTLSPATIKMQRVTSSILNRTIGTMRRRKEKTVTG